MFRRRYRKVLLSLGLFALLATSCTSRTAPGEQTATPPPENPSPPAAENPSSPIDPPSIPVDVPPAFSPELAAELVPIEPSPYYTAEPAPIFGASYFQAWPVSGSSAPVSAALASAGVERVQQAAAAAASDVPTMGAFSFQVTSLSYTPWSANMTNLGVGVMSLALDGQAQGDVDSGEIQIPRTQSSAQVTLGVWGAYSVYHDLGGGVGSVQYVSGLLESYTINLSTIGDKDGCTTGSQGIGSICWRARGLGSPPLCFGWQAQFLDSGPWDDFASESFAVSRYVQSFPAAYARVDVTVTRASSVESYHLSDALDERGCIAAEKLPVLEQWQGDIGSLVLKVKSQFCYDSSGGACAPPSGSTIAAGVNVEIRSGDSATGPQIYCWAVTDDPAKVPAECEQLPLAGADLTHLYFVAARSSVAQVAAVIGHILSREHDTGGGLGVEEALARRRLSSRNGNPIILTDTPCGGTMSASCTDSTRLYLAPGGILTRVGAPDLWTGSATDRKFLIAHEFGHFVQADGQGLAYGYSYNAPVVSTNPLCNCDQVVFDQQTHCLQSAEEPQVAQQEGFAHFFSALVWNRRVDEGGSGCTFVYYKSILDDHDLPGHVGASIDWNGYVLTPNVVAVSCSEPARWRDQHCLADDPDKAVLYGTEWDWMGFYWALVNDSDPARRWSVVDVFDAYRAIGKYPVSWDGGAFNGKNYASLTAGAQTTKGASSPGLAAFVAAGDTYGVSRK